MSKKGREKLRFNGFVGFNPPHYTMVPDEIFDVLLPHLSGAEIKVLLYICRRTFGFKKDNDNISISQMVNGISRKDGSQAGPNLPPIPDEACHPFRLKTATHSGRNLPL